MEKFEAANREMMYIYNTFIFESYSYVCIDLICSSQKKKKKAIERLGHIVCA